MGLQPRVKTESEPISEVSAVTTITNPVAQKNVAGTQINPATEDTLAKTMPTTVTKYAVALTTLNTEYSQALPANTKKFRVHLRSGNTFRLSFATGKVATPTDPYETIQSGCEKYEDNLNLTDVILYLAAPTSTEVAEVEAWV